MFLNCSTCFGRHTAHHQELKNRNYSLWFYKRFWLPVAAAMAQLLFVLSTRFLSSVVAPEISALIQHQQVLLCPTVDLPIYLLNAKYTCLALVKEKPSRQIPGFVRST
jgi:hypothetical protein